MTVLEKGQTWNEVVEKIMSEVESKDTKFKGWLKSREYMGGKFSSAQAWLKDYNIYKDINFNQFDNVHVITGGEGMGKSTYAIQTACRVDSKFTPEYLLYTPERLPDILEELLDKNEKGRALILDEGNMFLFSREAMSGGNKLMVKLLSICRQLNLYLIICVPNFFTIDSYIREHRLKALTVIYKRGKARCYNSKYLKKISVEGSKYKNVMNVKTPYDGWFNCWYSSNFPANLDQEEYFRLKKEHMKSFLGDLRESLIALNKPKASDYVDVAEIRKSVPLSKNRIIENIKAGKMEGKKIGGKWFALKTSVDKFAGNDEVPEEKIKPESGLPVIGGVNRVNKFTLTNL